jgi:hypothetical protein
MDLKDFLVAIMGDWVSLMSGIASVILTIVGTARNWQQVPRWILLIVAAICFFFACARVWTTEHRKYLSEVEHNIPAFKLSLGTGISFYNDEVKATIFLLNIRIVNEGADSAVIDWKAHYKSPTLERDGNCIQILTDPFQTTLPNGNKFILTRADQIMTKSSLPIPRGGKISGWLPVSLPGRIAPDGMKLDTTITVIVTDYKGKAYSAILKGDTGGDKFPGVPVPD